MLTEVIYQTQVFILPTYLNLLKDIKPLSERKDAKGKDTFDLGKWWCNNSDKVPSWAHVLRAVLTNCATLPTPSTIPPERVLLSFFSILNDSFDDDQDRALADYIQLSLQLQYNARGRDA